MSKEHWQIVNWNKNGQYGKVETMPVELAPPALIKTAEKLSKLIGRKSLWCGHQTERQ